MDRKQGKSPFAITTAQYHDVINDLLETRRGVYWVATNGGGVSRFNRLEATAERTWSFGSCDVTILKK